MNSAFVLFAYFAMLLSPCIVAQWGDLLSVRWIGALARRRRNHRSESFLVSFRQERYAMAVALEASFAAGYAEEFAAPKPFLVRKYAAVPETEAFLEARQRVAARVAQLAVAQKLRNDAAPPKVVALPPDVPATAATHIRPRKAVPAFYEPAEREAAYGSPVWTYQAPMEAAAAALFREQDKPQVHEFVEVAEAPVSPRIGPMLVRKPGDSGALEVAA